MKIKNRELTAKQERFVHEYMEDLNLFQAAKRAGYNDPNYGRQLIAKTNVKAAIIAMQRRINKELESETKITRRRILHEYARIAFMDISGLFDDQGNLKSFCEMDEDYRRAITGLEISITVNKDMISTKLLKIKLADKKAALDSLARILGLFEDRVNLGFNAETLKTILNVMPDELRNAVSTELRKLVSNR